MSRPALAERDTRRAHLETFGFVIARRCFDPEPIAVEVDETLASAFSGSGHANRGSARNRFRYVPMMCERTPVSLALLEQFAELATELLGSAVLPGRAKGVEYFESTGWHRDSEGPPRSLGFLCYLEPLDADTGALRVIPGTHGHQFARAVSEYLDHDESLPGLALGSAPGDVIVFDERLFHSSSGGEVRRQWRVDFVADHEGADATLRRYYRDQHPVGWDGGYDVDRYPSYGRDWQAGHPRWSRRLAEVGALVAADAEEAFVRAERRARTEPG